MKVDGITLETSGRETTMDFFVFLQKLKVQTCVFCVPTSMFVYVCISACCVYLFTCSYINEVYTVMC